MSNIVNMDRSGMLGIGKLHDDGHVLCNKGQYAADSRSHDRDKLENGDRHHASWDYRTFVHCIQIYVTQNDSSFFL